MRKFIGIFLGAMLAMACSFMAPAFAAEPTPQLCAAHSAKAVMAVVATDITCSLAAKANDATASASESRTRGVFADGSASASSPSLSVIALGVDHSGRVFDFLALSDPDDGSDPGDEDGGDGMKLAA